MHPMPSLTDESNKDSYTRNFVESFSEAFDFLNKGKRSTQGFFSVRHYYRNMDAIFLNWIEDLPDKRGGWIQSFFFLFMIHLFKLRKTRIIYILHNKASHYRSNRLLKRFLSRFIIRKSDYIITHSSEGLRYLEGLNRNYLEKARYYPHPLIRKPFVFKENPIHDILIWGSVIPYKGADRFLAYLHEHQLDTRYRILIAGKVKPPEYEKEITPFCNKNIQLDNRYIPDEDLVRYMADSKTVLFTYNDESILSSGVLMISLAHGAKIVAPHVGAFKDAEEDGLINTFETYEEMITLLDHDSPADDQIRLARIEAFIDENDWSQFARKASRWIIESEKSQ